MKTTQNKVRGTFYLKKCPFYYVMFGGCPYFLNKTLDHVYSIKLRSWNPTNRKNYIYNTQFDSLTFSLQKLWLILLLFLPLSPSKSGYWNVFLRICNRFSEKNCLDEPVFNKASRRNHSSSMNNIITNKTKHFPELFALGLQRPLKQRWHYFLFWSIITAKLDIYVCKCKDDYICNGLLQAICLVTINIWLNFFFEIKPKLASNFDAIY